MSDFLSREKEFLKLNEELNKKTKTVLEKKMESSTAITPRLGGNNASKLHSSSSSRTSTVKNPSVKRLESKRNCSDQSPENNTLPPNSPVLRKMDSASQTTFRTQPNSRAPSPKHETPVTTIKPKEKPPVKPNVINHPKSNTMPRNFRNNLKSNKTVVERELHKINAKLDAKAKIALDSVKENIENSKLNIKERSPPLRSMHITKNTDSPRGSRSPPLTSGRKSSSTISEEANNIMIETYRNKNFTESPSTEALNLVLNSPTSDAVSVSNKSEISASTKKDVATKATKRPPRQYPITIDRVAKKNVSTDGLIKYLKSKLSIIEVQLADNMNDLKKKSNELQASYETQKKLELQRDQAISKNNALTEQLSKTEDKLQSMERKLKDKEAECAAVTRELETLKRETRVISQANVNLEKRLYKTNEELENAKNNVASMKDGERELKESARQEKEAQDRQIKTLKKQRSELLVAYKKQLYLIDNLRRQNICMEQSKMISFGEKEFTKVLEWNMQN